MVHKRTDLEIKTERLLLRPLKTSDIDDVTEFMCNTENTYYARVGVQTRKSCEEYIEYSKDIPYIYAVVKDGSVIGTAELTICDDNQGELGWIIHKNYWNTGLCTEIGKILLELAFKDVKLRRVYAHCDTNNVGSWRVMEKIGMRREGTVIEGRCAYKHTPGIYNDEYSYGITADEFLNNDVITRNSVIDTITNRKSYRGKYKSDKIPKEHLVAIMQAGLDAPSGCNNQTTSLIAVDDEEVLSELKSLIDPPICETAPAVICVLTQKIFAYRDKCYNIQDYSAAIQNMLLAIKAFGYESCWYEGHITDEDNIGRKIADLLGVPDDYDLVCILPVGKASEKIPKVNKKSFIERAWFNSFKNFTTNDK